MGAAGLGLSAQVALGGLLAGMAIGAFGLRSAEAPSPSPAPRSGRAAAVDDATSLLRRAPLARAGSPVASGQGAPAPATGGGPHAGEPAPFATAIAAPAPLASATHESASTPEARRRHSMEIQAEALLALGRGEGQVALDALRTLAALGEEGDAAAIELAQRIAADIRGGKKIGVSSYDLYKTLQSEEVVPLLKRALLDPAADARFRANAIDNLAFSKNGDTLPFVLSLFEQERDPRVLDQMLGYLDEQSDPAVAATLARALPGRGTPDERISTIQALGRLGGDDAERALERASIDDPSPEVRSAAHVALLAQRPPVTGYLLSDVVPNSQAARVGLRPGDFLLSYNGVPMTPEVSLGSERDKVARGATVPVTIWRDGQTIEITLQAGQIGVDGRPVTPR